MLESVGQTSSDKGQSSMLLLWKQSGCASAVPLVSGAIWLLRATSRAHMTGKVYLMMVWHESLISSRSLLDYTQNSSFHKLISAFHNEESSGIFHVL